MSKKFQSILIVFIAFTVAIMSYRIYNSGYWKTRIAGVNTLSKSSSEVQKKTTKGLVVPHHQLATQLIDEAWQQVTDINPEHIVILGPNHWQPDKYHLITTAQLENLPLAIDDIQKLTSELNFLVDDPQLIAEEHSISIQIPFIKKYFPDAQIIPLVISRFYEPSEIEQTVQALNRYLPEQTLYVISVDFAHNLQSTAALENNQQTIKAIADFDYQQIINLGDDHIDAAMAMVYFLKIMESKEATNWQTITSSHGSLLTGDESAQSTSYVTGYFK